MAFQKHQSCHQGDPTKPDDLLELFQNAPLFIDVLSKGSVVGRRCFNNQRYVSVVESCCLKSRCLSTQGKPADVHASANI